MMQRRKIRPWSKLQKEVYLLVDPKLDFQIHCVAYRMGSQYGSTDLPRYWITLGKETIFNYPKQFIHSAGPDENSRIAYEALSIYPYSSETSEISNMLREYIDTPLSEIMTKKFEGDHWGLTDILRAADRQIGQRRLSELAEIVSNPAAQKILKKRMNTYKENERKAIETDGF